jgi:hypothetical protein
MGHCMFHVKPVLVPTSLGSSLRQPLVDEPKSHKVRVIFSPANQHQRMLLVVRPVTMKAAFGAAHVASPGGEPRQGQAAGSGSEASDSCVTECGGPHQSGGRISARLMGSQGGHPRI